MLERFSHHPDAHSWDRNEDYGLTLTESQRTARIIVRLTSELGRAVLPASPDTPGWSVEEEANLAACCGDDSGCPPVTPTVS